MTKRLIRIYCTFQCSTWSYVSIMCDQYLIIDFSIDIFPQHSIMELCYRPDEIMATKGDLVAFKHRHIFTYFHFAVCTVDSEAARQAIVQRNGDR
jgi:hypothetical protein